MHYARTPLLSFALTVYVCVVRYEPQFKLAIVARCNGHGGRVCGPPRAETERVDTFGVGQVYACIHFIAERKQIMSEKKQQQSQCA